jgi:glycosyltransferase involved in cell wall biosynthesis
VIGIVIPAHDEAALVGECLAAALQAAQHPGLNAEPVEIVVVLDHCTDGTAEIVSAWPVDTLSVSLRNVGAARALGAQALLARGARWLAFTDADSQVAQDWLVQQLRLEADVVCGTVQVDEWSDHAQHAGRLHRHFLCTYNDADGHRHIHGANLGVSADAYGRVGGFLPLATSEDVALIEALQHVGAHIAWSAAPRVLTSARRSARAPGGFAAALCQAVDAMRAPALIAT